LFETPVEEIMKSILSLILAIIISCGVATAQTADECLTRVKSMEAMMPNLVASAKGAIHGLLPDPEAYAKTLPPIDEVIASGDKVNLKNYGGLSEAFFYAGDKEKGRAIYTKFKANAEKIYGPDDLYCALIEGDMGLVYFYEKDYETAEPFLLYATKRLEENLTAAHANNLVTNYMCLCLINDKRGDVDNAKKYAKQLVDLAIKQRQKGY
jgi:hypothetical protein